MRRRRAESDGGDVEGVLVRLVRAGSRKAEAVEESKAAEGKTRTGPLMDRCAAILEVLSLRDDSFWFLAPVSPEDVPDYYDVIDSPMDYGTIKGKLEAGTYSDAAAFAPDGSHLTYLKSGDGSLTTQLLDCRIIKTSTIGWTHCTSKILNHSICQITWI